MDASLEDSKYDPSVLSKDEKLVIQTRLYNLKKFEYADYLDWISIKAPINNSVQLLILDQKSLNSVKITDEIIENIRIL